MNKRNALYGLGILPPLVPLSVYAYKALQGRGCAVPQNHDVFLSFRGPDSRTGFADFLYSSLVAAGVHVFRDDDALPIGEEIGPELLRAIRSCRIAIPIISVQYAQSKWCLRELAEIMDCHREHGKSVFPIFYKVDVADVSNLRGRFGAALFEHRKVYRDSSEEERVRDLSEWRKALASVARIRGWISQTIANGHEGELVKIVVARVLTELKTSWIERLPLFPILMSNHHIRSLYYYYSKEKRRHSQCQVFLAFRGPDTRYGFAAYLYISLVAAKIRVFYDDDTSIIGKVISDELMNAIDHCKISIPILSENFASSSWCLRELSYMVDCKKTKGQTILPIFYKVKPSHVKYLTDCFGDRLREYEKRCDRDQCEKWKEALKKVGSFKGWESERINNGHEAVLVKRVVQEVSRLLKNPQTHDRHLHPLNIDSILG
ncbi:uncharacterized protein LOC115693992 [Syzygium oleosum]|uniref:uncharacterized protein LOC115693992 n=1 Tax=Syzygium oleosum TaxID=219896 RepID=UPI0024BBAC54|nr:uncharacterized protein LOC115693992 [Syzygium oleosum]